MMDGIKKVGGVRARGRGGASLTVEGHHHIIAGNTHIIE